MSELQNKGLCVFLLEEIKTEKELKIFVDKAENPIKITDIDATKRLTKDYISKYADLVIDNSNYAKEAKTAEKDMREFCSLLRNMDKKNASIHTQLRKIERSNIDDLISIIEPVQKKLKSGIDAVIEKNKAEIEAKKKEKEERDNKIKDKITEQKAELASFVRGCDGNVSELATYNCMIDEYQGRIDSNEFYEFTAIAERDIAIATGERKIIEQAIENKKMKQEQRELKILFDAEIQLSKIHSASTEEELRYVKTLMTGLELMKFYNIDNQKKADDLIEYSVQLIIDVEQKINEKQKEKDKERAVCFTKIYTDEIDYITSKKESDHGFDRIKELLKKIDCDFTDFSDYEYKRLEIFEKYDIECNNYKKRLDILHKEEEKQKIKEEKLLNLRREQLIRLGFSAEEDGVSCKHYKTVLNSELLSYDEIDWIQGIEFIKSKIDESKEEERKEEKKEIERITNRWHDVLKLLKEENGDVQKYELTDGPSPSDLQRVTKEIEKLRAEKDKRKRQEIKEDLSFFKELSKKSVDKIESEIKQTEFRGVESKGILITLVKRLNQVIYQTLG